MISSVIFCLWTISCQLTLSLVTPTTLLALANLHLNKVKAAAHALQTRAKYRNAFRQPCWGLLGDTKLIRNPRQLGPIDEADFANEDIDFDINDNGLDSNQFGPPDVLQNNGEVLDERADEVRNADARGAQETPDLVCMVNNHAPDGNPLLIPVMHHADKMGEMNLRQSSDEGIPQSFQIDVLNGGDHELMPNTDSLDQHMQNDQFEFERPPDMTPGTSRDANPHFFKHGFSHKFSKTISHEVLPSQADVHNQIVINPQTHATHVVNPPVHVNVMQNQNSAVVPQQTFQPAFATVPVAPATVVNHVPVTQNAQQFVNTGSGLSHGHGSGCPHCHEGLSHGHGSVCPKCHGSLAHGGGHSGFGHGGGNSGFGHGEGHSGFGHGTSVSQGQFVQTHNSGWSGSKTTIAQNQNVHTGREADDNEQMNRELVASPNFEQQPHMTVEEEPHRMPPEMEILHEYEPRLGTFFTDGYQPVMPEYFDQNILHTLPTQGEEYSDGPHQEMRTKKESSEEDDKGKGHMKGYGEGGYYGSYNDEDPMKKMFDNERKKIEKRLHKIRKKMEKMMFKSDKNKEYDYNYKQYDHYNPSYDKYDKSDTYGHHKVEYNKYDNYNNKKPAYNEHDKLDKLYKKGDDNKKPIDSYSIEDANSYEATDYTPSYTSYQNKPPQNNYNNAYDNSNTFPYYKYTNYYRQAQDPENFANTAKFTENDSIIHKTHEILPEEHPLVGQPMEMDDNKQDQPIENKDAKQEEGVRSLQDPLLGYIVQVPDRQYYRRTARSTNKSTNADLNKILLAEKEMINTIKKHANHDKDLMMIGYIGDSFINDWEKRHNKTRNRREIGRDSSSIRRLLTDPAAKFDMPKTLENLGAVTRETFEHESTPLYHVRHIVGSAKDAVMAAMKIPNQNIVTPSQYSIVSPKDEQVSYISPKIFARNDDFTDNQITNTFEKVGSVVRDSVKSSQDVLSHIGDIANHGKDAIYSFQHSTPRVVLKKLPPHLQQPMDKTVIISPRIFDVYDERERVGSEQGNTNPDFIKLGHIFDAIGLSSPNSELKFQRVTIQPRYTIPNTAFPILQSRFSDVTVEDINTDQDNLLGRTLDNLEAAKESMGAKNLRDFFEIIRNKIRNFLRNELKEFWMNRPGIRIATPKNIEQAVNKMTQIRATRAISNVTNPVENPETVGAGLFPDVLLHPFMDQLTPKQQEKLNSMNYTESKKSDDSNHRPDHIVGAINSMLFERMFNESVSDRNDTRNPFDVFNRDHQWTSQNTGEENDGEEVSTSITMQGPMLEPFMGKISAESFDEFYHNYQLPPGYDDHSDDDKY